MLNCSALYHSFSSSLSMKETRVTFFLNFISREHPPSRIWGQRAFPLRGKSGAWSPGALNTTCKHAHSKSCQEPKWLLVKHVEKPDLLSHAFVNRGIWCNHLFFRRKAQ